MAQAANILATSYCDYFVIRNHPTDTKLFRAGRNLTITPTIFHLDGSYCQKLLNACTFSARSMMIGRRPSSCLRSTTLGGHSLTSAGSHRSPSYPQLPASSKASFKRSAKEGSWRILGTQLHCSAEKRQLKAKKRMCDQLKIDSGNTYNH